MAKSSWSVELSDGRHLIEADYGIWSGRTIVRVDGRIASTSSQALNIQFNRGVDLPISVDRHQVIVSIRPNVRGAAITTGYTFGLSIDGVPAPGTQPVAPTQAGNIGPRLIETLAWASAGGGVIGLSRGGENPTAFLFLLAPAACSFVIRRTTLPVKAMALTCLGIIVVGIFAVAAIGAVARR